MKPAPRFVVCVGLNNEYMLYYICPMHTLFTVFVILIMYFGQEANKSTKAACEKKRRAQKVPGEQ